MFLEHVSFFYILDNTCDVIKIDLTSIDPIFDDIDRPSSYIPCIVDSSCTISTYALAHDTPLLLWLPRHHLI